MELEREVAFKIGDYNTMPKKELVIYTDGSIEGKEFLPEGMTAIVNYYPTLLKSALFKGRTLIRE